MRSSQIWVAVVALLLALSTQGSAEECLHPECGVDPTVANSWGSVLLGEALGQTFEAESNLIETITVWRVAWQANYVYGLHLYVTGTDSTGRPDVDQLILNGPAVFHTDGDGVNPTPFEFVFDPPLQLPKLGRYYFAVQSDPCNGIWDLLAVDGTDYYQPGQCWVNGRSLSCDLRPFPQGYPNVDLAFRVRFCTFATPTRRSTWGEIKATYR